MRRARLRRAGQRRRGPPLDKCFGLEAAELSPQRLERDWSSSDAISDNGASNRVPRKSLPPFRLLGLRRFVGVSLNFHAELLSDPAEDGGEIVHGRLVSFLVPAF